MDDRPAAGADENGEDQAAVVGGDQDQQQGAKEEGVGVANPPGGDDNDRPPEEGGALVRAGRDDESGPQQSSPESVEAQAGGPGTPKEGAGQASSGRPRVPLSDRFPLAGEQVGGLWTLVEDDLCALVGDVVEAVQHATAFLDAVPGSPAWEQPAASQEGLLRCATDAERDFVQAVRAAVGGFWEGVDGGGAPDIAGLTAMLGEELEDALQDAEQALRHGQQDFAAALQRDVARVEDEFEQAIAGAVDCIADAAEEVQAALERAESLLHDSALHVVGVVVADANGGNVDAALAQAAVLDACNRRFAVPLEAALTAHAARVRDAWERELGAVQANGDKLRGAVGEWQRGCEGATSAARAQFLASLQATVSGACARGGDEANAGERALSLDQLALVTQVQELSKLVATLCNDSWDSLGSQLEQAVAGAGDRWCDAVGASVQQYREALGPAVQAISQDIAREALRRLSRPVEDALGELELRLSQVPVRPREAARPAEPDHRKERDELGDHGDHGDHGNDPDERASVPPGSGTQQLASPAREQAGADEDAAVAGYRLGADAERVAALMWHAQELQQDEQALADLEAEWDRVRAMITVHLQVVVATEGGGAGAPVEEQAGPGEGLTQEEERELAVGVLENPNLAKNPSDRGTVRAEALRDALADQAAASATTVQAADDLSLLTRLYVQYLSEHQGIARLAISRAQAARVDVRNALRANARALRAARCSVPRHSAQERDKEEEDGNASQEDDDDEDVFLEGMRRVESAKQLLASGKDNAARTRREHAKQSKEMKEKSQVLRQACLRARAEEIDARTHLLRLMIQLADDFELASPTVSALQRSLDKLTWQSNEMRAQLGEGNEEDDEEERRLQAQLQRLGQPDDEERPHSSEQHEDDNQIALGGAGSEAESHGPRSGAESEEESVLLDEDEPLEEWDEKEKWIDPVVAGAPESAVAERNENEGLYEERVEPPRALEPLAPLPRESGLDILAKTLQWSQTIA